MRKQQVRRSSAIDRMFDFLMQLPEPFREFVVLILLLFLGWIFIVHPETLNNLVTLLWLLHSFKNG